MRAPRPAEANRHLVEALRDALLERHELIGHEITDVLEAAAASAGAHDDRPARDGPRRARLARGACTRRAPVRRRPAVKAGGTPADAATWSRSSRRRRDGERGAGTRPAVVVRFGGAATPSHGGRRRGRGRPADEPGAGRPAGWPAS